ncbi:13026_t:CDS:2 [Entrophospora sp. SA101]|nr:13026_t:CDS:2 [Entrophospora sp. SA101]CAJ0857499.1 2029_t:CDS:2 [Entrophospora sp. SA101]CAJ0919831.1 20244_t:CDS:2 [Entrophospora sp. SA101]
MTFDTRRFIERLINVYTAPNDSQESRFLLILKSNITVGVDLWIQYKKRTTNMNTRRVNDVIKQWDESPTSSCGMDAFVTLLNPSSYNPELFECLAEAVTPSRELVIRWMAPYLRRFSKYIPPQNMWLCDQKRMGPEYMNRDVGEMYLRQGICECVDVLRQFNGREEVIHVALNVLEGSEMPMYLKVMLRGISDEETPW